ncbi:MAG: glycerophosphodiester phosphodiesterase [Alkalibacterium sp.]|nr:glycerophosphodiester phosphodiesterase [Alkalibacterium sp.]TVP91833.1 MAG: glycerophosphodiester phosphodiesterase [Alkalibacterium sp.]
MKLLMKIVGSVLGVILLIWLLLFINPIASERETVFTQESEDTLVIAHRGGMFHAPENTMEAFSHAESIEVDILEYDVFITSDGELVAIHDDTVDRTTDGSGRVNDMSLEEIQALDAGYHFENEEGEANFRDNSVIVPSVEEIFQEFGHMRQLIELKATNDPDRYEEMIQEMWRLIEEYEVHDTVLIASFDHEINLRFDEVADGTVAIGAGEQETRDFVMKHKAFANALYTPTADAFQLPTEQEGFNLADWKLIRGAEQRGMEVYYWTINDEETMRELIDLGAHGIMTDDTELLTEILAEDN